MDVHYLGALRGVGVVTCQGEKVGRADYDFDGFLTKPAHVTGSGEIRMSPLKLKEVFGRGNVELVTNDGRVLSVRFSERRLSPASDVACVEVGGELPTPQEWPHPYARTQQQQRRPRSTG
jgi:hypothetical protein